MQVGEQNHLPWGTASRVRVRKRWRQSTWYSRSHWSHSSIMRGANSGEKSLSPHSSHRHPGQNQSSSGTCSASRTQGVGP